MQLHVSSFFFFLLCASMRGPRLPQYTPCVLCTRTSLALLLSHSCSLHSSRHLDWPPWPVCWLSDLTVTFFCALNSFSKAPPLPNIPIYPHLLSKPSDLHWCISVLFLILCGDVSHLVSSTLLFFFPFFLCSCLNPNEQASGESHSIASLTTDVEKCFFYFFFTLNQTFCSI